MKKLISFLTTISVCLVLTGCPKETVQEFIRTSKTGSRIVKKQVIPVYERVCKIHEVRGQHRSCGLETFASFDARSCVSDCGSRAFGELPKSSDDIQRCEQNCLSEFDVEFASCNHEEEFCRSVLDRKYNLTVDIAFEGPKLRGNQTEKIICKVKQRGTILDFKLKIESDYYKYKIPRSFSMDLAKSKRLKINVINIGKK